MVSLKTVQIDWNVLAYFTPKSRLLNTTGENHRLVRIGFTRYSLSSTSTMSWNHSLFPQSVQPPILLGIFLRTFFPSLVCHPATYLGTLSRASITKLSVFPAGLSSSFFPVTVGERGPSLHLDSESLETGPLSLFSNSRFRPSLSGTSTALFIDFFPNTFKYS